MYDFDVLSLDLGYDGLKWYTEYCNGRFMERPIQGSILSIVAPTYLDTVGDSYGDNAPYGVAIRPYLRPDDPRSKEGKDYLTKLWLVDRAAILDPNAVNTLQEERPEWFSQVLVLSATAISGIPAPGGCYLCVSLPLSMYDGQKKILQAQLKEIDHLVTVRDSHGEKRVKFSGVIVRPQGATAIAARDELPENGIYIMVDIGRGTTEVVTYRVLTKDGRKVFEKIDSYSKSLPVGTHKVQKNVALVYERETGLALTPARTYDIMTDLMKGHKVALEGEDVRIPYQEIVEDAERVVVGQIQDFVGDIRRQANTVDFAGGGSMMFKAGLQKLFKIGKLIPDPVYANAKGGYRELVRLLKEKGIVR